MSTSRLDLGHKVAGTSAGALFILMLFPWYGVTDTGLERTAWQAFSRTDLVLFLVIALTLAFVSAQAVGAMPNLRLAPGALVAVAGALATLLVLMRLLSTPDVDLVAAHLNTSAKLAAYLALLASAGIAYGGHVWNLGPAASRPRATPARPTRQRTV